MTNDPLVDANIRAKILPDDVLRGVEKRCQNMIMELPETVKPVFTHRDLYLANTLVQDSKFVAIIDFEAARFNDGLWDFVKPDAWIFRRHSYLRPFFLEGYTRLHPWQDDFAQRIFLYQGLEYLAAFPYFGVRYPNQEMLLDFSSLLTQWLKSDPMVIMEWWVSH